MGEISNPQFAGDVPGAAPVAAAEGSPPAARPPAYGRFAALAAAVAAAAVAVTLGANAALLDAFATVRHDGSQLVAAGSPAGDALATGSATATQSVGQLVPPLGARGTAVGRALRALDRVRHLTLSRRGGGGGRYSGYSVVGYDLTPISVLFFAADGSVLRAERTAAGASSSHVDVVYDAREQLAAAAGAGEEGAAAGGRALRLFQSYYGDDDSGEQGGSGGTGSATTSSGSDNDGADAATIAVELFTGVVEGIAAGSVPSNPASCVSSLTGAVDSIGSLWDDVTGPKSDVETALGDLATLLSSVKDALEDCDLSEVATELGVTIAGLTDGIGEIEEGLEIAINGINIYEDLEGAATDWGAQLYEDCGKKLGDIVAMLM